MSNEIATQTKPVSMLPAELVAIQPKYGDSTAMEKMSAGSFLPRIMILQAQSKMCIGRDPKAKPGEIVLVRGKDTLIRNYGDSMAMFVLQHRPKALAFDAAGKGRAFFKPAQKEFADIENKALQKPRPKGYLFGPEYLVYVPDVDQIATFFFSTPTMRESCDRDVGPTRYANDRQNLSSSTAAAINGTDLNRSTLPARSVYPSRRRPSGLNSWLGSKHRS